MDFDFSEHPLSFKFPGIKTEKCTRKSFSGNRSGFSTAAFLAVLVLSFTFPALLPQASAQTQTLSFGNSTIDNQFYNRGEEISTLTLPAATASTGNPTITYTLSPSLPAGLSFDATNRTISGTPTTAGTHIVYTYTADATNYDPATLTFNIAVTKSTLTASNEKATTATLTLSGWDRSVDGTWKYKRTSPSEETCTEVSSGLEVSLTELSPNTSYTYRAYGGPTSFVDCDPLTQIARETFTTLPGTLSFSSTVSDQIYIRGTAITTLTLPAATASPGSPTTTYTLSPALPDGLTFNAANRTITGTPSEPAASREYTYTAAAANYTSATLKFDIAVLQPTLSLTNSTVSDQTYTRGTAITTLTLPAATASPGSPTITYALSPALPDGLTFNAATREITGTPTEASASKEYTYTASATHYTSATLTFDIEVLQPTLSLANSTVSDQTYTRGTEIPTLALPEASASAGSPAITYALSPDPPDGLTFDAATREITGTPTEASASKEYTYTASATYYTSANLKFDIAVKAQRSSPSGTPSSPDPSTPTPSGEDEYEYPESAPDVTAENVEDRDTLQSFVRGAIASIKEEVAKTEQDDVPDLIKSYREDDGPWKHGAVYLFIIKASTAEVVLDGLYPELEGEELAATDKEGDDVGEKIVEAGGEEGTGDFITYYWKDPLGEEDANPNPEWLEDGESPGTSYKVSYVEGFAFESYEPDEVFIMGSGIYPQEPPVEPEPPEGGGCAVSGTGGAQGAAFGLLMVSTVVFGAFSPRSRAK